MNSKSRLEDRDGGDESGTYAAVAVYQQIRQQQIVVLNTINVSLFACMLEIIISTAYTHRYISELMKMWQSSCNSNFIIVIEFIMMRSSLQ